MYVGGSHQIAVYATRALKPGDELFMDYNDSYPRPVSVTHSHLSPRLIARSLCSGSPKRNKSSAAREESSVGRRRQPRRRRERGSLVEHSQIRFASPRRSQFREIIGSERYTFVYYNTKPPPSPPLSAPPSLCAWPAQHLRPRIPRCRLHSMASRWRERAE